MRRRLLSGLLVTAVLGSVPAIARPNPCQRTNNVPFTAIAAELSKLVQQCGPMPVCPTQRDGEVYPPLNDPKQLGTIWSFNGTPPPFTIAAQDKLVASAKAVAGQHQPKCANGNPKVVAVYAFETKVTNKQKHQIDVRLTYVCCSKEMPH